MKGNCMANQWNYAQNGQSLGPIPEEQLKAMLLAGRLSWADLVWCDGMAAWTPAGQVQALAPAPRAPQLPAIELDEPAAIRTPPLNPSAPPQADFRDFRSGATSQAAVPFEVVEALRQTKPWARLLAVLGFIGIGFMVLASVAMLAFESSMKLGLPRGFGVGMMAVYLFIAGIQLPAALFLNRYASRIGDLLDSQSPSDLQEALVAQKSFWRYIGILTLIVMCIYILIFVFAVVGAGLVRRMH
jgi:GYF domain 2